MTQAPPILLTAEEIWRRFTHHAPIEDQAERYEQVRALGAELVRELTYRCPASRELSLAVTSIEQAIMWANAAIARREAPLTSPQVISPDLPDPTPAPEAATAPPVVPVGQSFQGQSAPAPSPDTQQ